MSSSQSRLGRVLARLDGASGNLNSNVSQREVAMSED